MTAIGTRPWGPSETTTVAWYDAADVNTITESSGSVSQWDDKSGNDRHATQGTGGNQPTYKEGGFNGLPIIEFGSGSINMAISIPAGNLIAFMVCRTIPSNFNTLLQSISTNTFMPFMDEGSATTNVFRVDGSNDPSSLDLYLNGSSTGVAGANRGAYYTAVFTDNPDGILGKLGTFTTTATTIDKIGDDSSGWNAWYDMCELIFVEDTTSAQDQKRIEGYLAWKWGLESKLPDDHPFKYLSPSSSSEAANLWLPSDTTTAAWFDAVDESTITYASSTLQSQLGQLDLTANGGINPYTGSAWAAGDTYRLAFVTSTTKDATSTDIEHYNIHVQAAADAAGLGGAEWKAFVATTAVDAKTNTGLNGNDSAIFNFNDEIVGDNIADMFDTVSSSGGVQNKIRYDENGNGPGLDDLPSGVPFNTFTPVWTGTDQNGDPQVGNEVGQSTVSFGICEAETWFQFDRGTNSSTTERTYILAFSEVLTVSYDSDKISQWDDKSGNANHAVQATSGEQPSTGVATIGGMNAIQFQLANDENLSVPDDASLDFDGDGGLSYFGILNYKGYTNQGSGVNSIMSKGAMLGASASYGWRVLSGQAIVHKGGTDYQVTGSDLRNQDIILSTVVDQGTQMEGWTNGTSDGTDTVGTGLSDNTNALMIGGDPTQNQRYADVDFGEIIIIAGPVTSTVRQKIEGYLAWKWGIPHKLPRTHPYADTPPTA